MEQVTLVRVFGTLQVKLTVPAKLPTLVIWTVAVFERLGPTVKLAGVIAIWKSEAHSLIRL
jgi:hypothetical protein